MNIEHRLQHAAREMREVPIAVPPLGSPRRVRTLSRVHALATPMLVPLLFVAGALFAIGATRPVAHRSVQTDIPAADSPPSAGAAESVADTSGSADLPVLDAPSPPTELEKVAVLANTRPTLTSFEVRAQVTTQVGRPANISRAI